jgi:hypothetical protein
MGVANEAVFFHAIENLLHLHRRVDGVFREQVFVDRPARRTVHAQEVIPQHAHFQAAKKFPTLGGLRGIGLGLELGAGPVRCLFGGLVEVGWFIQRAEIVIAHQRPFAALRDKVHTLHGVGTVAEDVAKTDDAIDLGGLRIDVREHGLQRFEVGMDVADDSGAHRELQRPF